jgi:hypothetical protein
MLKPLSHSNFPNNLGFSKIPTIPLYNLSHKFPALLTRGKYPGIFLGGETTGKFISMSKFFCC